MKFRIIKRDLGGFIVQWRPHMLSSWRYFENPERIRQALMKGYIGPVPALIFETIETAKKEIKNFKKSKSKQVGKNSRIVWEE